MAYQNEFDDLHYYTRDFFDYFRNDKNKINIIDKHSIPDCLSDAYDNNREVFSNTKFWETSSPDALGVFPQQKKIIS